MCDHGDCKNLQTNPSMQQTLDELDFERGIWSAALDGDEARVGQLLAKGTCVDARDKAGYTALHYASRAGNLSMCQVLLSAGADVNATTRAGHATPLHRAAFAGQEAVVKILLNSGANPQLKDADGRTPADRALENNELGVCSLLSIDNL